MNKYGLDLIGILDEPDYISPYCDYLSIHDYLFEAIFATNQDVCIKMKKIIKDVYSGTIKESINKRCNNSNKTWGVIEPFHNPQIKRQQNVLDYSNNSLDDFLLIVICHFPIFKKPNKSILFQLPLELVLNF